MAERSIVNYSDSYRDALSTAILESSKLGFTRQPIISVTDKIEDNILRTVSDLINELSTYFNMLIPSYWGNYCQTLSTQIFAHLNKRGIPANIVLGNVIINGTDGFGTTLESLQKEFRSTEKLVGEQHVHAWISLGDDTIVDAALPPRLVKHYEAPSYFDEVIFIGRACEFDARYNIQYKPFLIGTEFFAKTNPPDPMYLLSSL